MVSFLRQFAYNVGLVIAFALTWPYLSYRLWRRGKMSRFFPQRWGIYSDDIRTRVGAGVDVWIHAVSVGEVMIARLVIERMRELEPRLRLAITTTTATGFRVAQALENEDTIVLYNPMDFLWVVRRTFALLQPKLLVLVEAEIWPNYIWVAKRRGIPVYLVNARLSRRSESRFYRFRAFCRPVLQEVDLVFAQDEGDIPRLARAGFAQEAIFLLGSLKYDVADLPPIGGQEIESWWQNAGWSDDDLVLLAGSTHPGEEEMMARIFLDLRAKWPQARLVLAPRHAERGPQILGMCQRLGLRGVLRTDLTARRTNGAVPEALVLNTTGELKSVYPKATLVFVGKSLRGSGGQNFIEAARVGTPILVGPNMQNFETQTREFVRCGGLLQVNNETELAEKIGEMLDSPQLRADTGARGLKTFRDNLGASRRTASILVQYLQSQR